MNYQVIYDALMTKHKSLYHCGVIHHNGPFQNINHLQGSFAKKVLLIV
jgi:hypothetical protein